MKKKNWIIAIIVIFIAGVAGWFFLVKNKEGKVVYNETAVKRGDLIIRIQSSGTVSPQNRLEIKPPIAGRIEDVLVKEGDVVQKGTILAWISSTERAALLDAVRAQGASELKKWEGLYKPTPVVAPIKGTVILRSVEPGQSFINTESIFTMADRLTVKAQVDETDIAKVKIGLPVIITLDAYSSKPVNGKVVHVAYDATLTNNVTTYIVDVLPDEVPDFMRSGMTASVDIEVDHKDGILMLPLTSLITTNEGTRVKVKQNDKISEIDIQLGTDNGKMVEIISGINEGEIVLTEDKSLGDKKKGGSLFMPAGGGRRGGKR